MAVAIGLLVASSAWFKTGEQGVSVTLQMRVQTDANGELFVNTGSGYSPANSIRFQLQPDGVLHTYTINLPDVTPVAIRVDPGSAAGPVEVRSIEVRGVGLRRFYRVDGLERSIRSLHDLDKLPVQGQMVRLLANGADPYFELSVPYLGPTPGLLVRGLFTAMAAGGTTVFAYLLALLVGQAVRLAQRCISVHPFVISFFGRTANWCSDGRLIRLDYRAGIFLWFMAIVFLVMVGGKLHLSSIGMWNTYVPQANVQAAEVWGQARAIRSDEWVVQTPFMLSQAQNGFPIENQSLGAPGVPLIASVPVKSLIGYVQPRFWGFYLLDVERGFSYLWAYRLVGMVVLFFFAFNVLTRGDFWLSLLGTLWVYLSSFNQWWLGTNLPDMLIAFAAIIISGCFVFFGKTKRNILIGGGALVTSAISFAAALYPAFLVPLFWLGVFLFLGFLADRTYRAYFTDRYSLRLVVAGAALALVGVFVVWWLWKARVVLNLVAHSEYPGDRSNVVWGTVGLLRVFSGFYDFFYLEHRFPKALGNVCEASNFILLFPIVGVCIIWRAVCHRKVNGPMMALLLFCCSMITWAVFGFPAWLAKATLMSMSPPERSFIGLGLGSIFLAVAYMGGAATERRAAVGPGRMFALFAGGALLVFWLGILFNLIDGEFYSLKRVAFIAVIGGVLVYAICSRDKIAFSYAIVFLIAPGVAVNPLSRGLDAIYKKDLAQRIAKHGVADQGKQWVVVGGITSPQFFKAAGASVWNGVRFISETQTFIPLDPQGKSSKIWNRYAHIIIEPNFELSSPVFELVQTDVVKIRLNLCGKELKSMGVTNVAVLGQKIPDSAECLDELAGGPVDGFWLYELRQ
ncbi:DUF7657 domain-containing protein [Cupriavidus pinatubonensis]|uniref:Glycosyltransferase RgtA/B/C/D-like domain-containing protein n=1 Tax=Cupriavidus pinatubonensis TaxID=248026 RepID=A0ABM8XJ75_9BURK|nr:hypothetical protein [Cupriavidus pinatubonensis]CAG9180237.1 hypothetical protein LMG23994_04378 [Cupriavidus pinatubonensis]